MGVANQAVSKGKRGLVIALKIFGTVAIAILSAGIVFALAARYQIPFVSPPADEEGSAAVIPMTLVSCAIAIFIGAALVFVGV
jgi:hypothetical protein